MSLEQRIPQGYEKMENKTSILNLKRLKDQTAGLQLILFEVPKEVF